LSSQRSFRKLSLSVAVGGTERYSGCWARCWVSWAAFGGQFEPA
jgi:hypothetical protein